MFNYKRPMEGLKVIELASFVALTTAGRLLADWGAEVIKVESFAGDPWRFYGPKCQCPATEQENPLFDIWNADKKDILLNLKDEKGLEVLFRLLDDADIFITNNRPKALQKMGLDYDSLKERYPRLIYGLVTGYGLEGPDAPKPGFDTAAYFARGGLNADLATVAEGSYPAIAIGGFGDTAVGTSLFAGLCAALYVREKSGQGDFINMSIFGQAMWQCGMMGLVNQPPYNEPYPKHRLSMKPINTFYKCKDGEWLTLGILDHSRYFRPLCEALEIPEVADDPRFGSQQLVLDNREALIPILEKAFIKFDSQEVFKRLSARDIVFDRLSHFRDLYKDKQAIANDYFRKITFDSGRSAMLPMSPIKSRNMGKTPFGRGPLMGEHTDEILSGCGYTKEEIEEMKANGVAKQHD